MTTEQTPQESPGQEPRADGSRRTGGTATTRRSSPWPGFFTGMLFVTLVPGAYAGILRLLFHYDTAERLFPYVLVILVVPAVLVAVPRTRRFGIYMFIGMVLTTAGGAGVASLVLYFMVRSQG